MAKHAANDPESVLYRGSDSPPTINCCDHYAGTEKLIQKSIALQTEKGAVFDITCDLEDGAGVGSLEERRDMVLTFVCSKDNRFDRVGVRVNDFRNPAWKLDVQETVRRAGKKVSHITIPKATSGRETASMLKHLRACCKKFGVKRTIPVHVLIETHGGVHEARAIAALDGVRGLDFGLMDFVSEHQGAIPSTAMYSPGQFEHALVTRAKTELVAAACAFGRIAAHNVTPQYDDVEQTKNDARLARQRFGFQRMWSIHPSQIGAILEGMQPEVGEVTLAGEILFAAQRADWAPISHRGKLHDRASYRYYWQILKRAHSLGVDLDSTVARAFFPAV